MNYFVRKLFQVLGNSNEYIYIWFSVDANINILWSKNISQYLSRSKEFPHLKRPIKVNSSVKKLVILENYDENITEGNPFNNPIKIQALDERNKPLKNLLVI